MLKSLEAFENHVLFFPSVSLTEVKHGKLIMLATSQVSSDDL